MRTFAEVFAELIRRRGISVSAVASELGFSSKTALFRILNGQSRPATNRKCMEAACASRMLALTQEETAELRTALRVGEMGRQAFAMNELLRNLIYPIEPDEPADVPLTGGFCGSMRKLLEVCAALSGIYIDVLGRCPQDVFVLLHRFSERENVAGIRHIFAVDDQSVEAMHVLGDVSFILFSPVYAAYVINETGVEEKNWLFHSGVIVITGLRADGGRRTHLLTPVKAGYHLITGENGEPDALFARMIDDARERIRPLKKLPISEDSVPFPENYIRFTESCAQIERGREIYMMKPDVPLPCVPPDLLRPMAEEAFKAKEPSAYMELAIERLYEIHKARFDNFFGKKKVTHMVFNLAAMRRFAATGAREDHFFMLRPYTPSERAAILQNLRGQMERNPQLNVWFGRGTNLVSDKEVTAYEGYGLAIIKANTSWHLEKDHREITLHSRALAASFKEYVLSEIIPGEVFSREESFRILDELIELAGKS